MNTTFNTVTIMPTRNYLAVDLGATSGRTIVATYDGQKVEMRELTRFKNPMIPIAGMGISILALVGIVVIRKKKFTK